MPSTGTPSSSSSVRSRGAPSAYTDAGPPERISPRGRRAVISSSGAWCGSSSANTPHSRMRRAISCEYCPPKSRTRTSSVTGSDRAGAGRTSSSASAEGARTRSVIRDGYPCGHGGAAVRAHADRLLALKLLALALQRGRHHHLGALEVADVLVAAG